MRGKDRLKTKALDKKCQLLVQENEKLMEKLCELEMQRGEEDIQAKLKNQIEELNQRINDEKSRSIALQVAKEKVEEELAREKLSFENQVIALQQAPQHVVEPEAPDYLIREIEHLREKLSTAIREAEDLRAENFDLQMSKASTAPKETPKDEDYSEEVVREIKAKLEAVTEELSESLEAVESLKKEKQAIRVELDNARLSISETKEVREQVIRLKEELDQERETGRQNWEEACKRMAIPDANSRKNSIEVQYQQYTIAFEEKIEALQKALEDAKGTIAQDKEEKKKLKAALRQLRDKKEVKEEPKVEKLEVQLQQAAPAPDQSQADAVEMKRQIDELQLEAKLSGELNVELGRAMLEMEKKIDLMRLENDSQKREEETTVMELRLHEMMVQELSEEIENLKASLAQSSAPNACERCETFGEIIENLRQENKSLKAELDRVRQQMEGLGVERVSEREELDSMHDVEVRRLCTAIEDARREVSDLEQKLLLNEEALQKSLTTSKQYSHQSTTTDESSVVSNDNVTRGFYSDDEPTTSQDDQNRLIEENAILRECIDESNKAQGGMSQDIAKLLELKEELETAVNALKAEVWSLNGQLKSHLIDRENLEDRLCDLEDRVEKEKKRADGLDVELQEQVELTEKAQQRAAQAENESNRRLAECLEMENRREEIEKAYASLSEYYNQLQSAYNVIYAKVHTQQQEQLLQSAPQQLTLDDSELVPILLELMTVLEIDSDSAQGTTERLQLVVQKVKSVLNEVAEYRSALAEQKRISEAIQDRLETLEAEVERGATASSKERIQELEGEIEWKQEECVSLKRRISEMEKALDVLAVKGNEDEAAKLATRQADVDSLFRTNAELAHTNVRLQNEVDEKDEVRLTAERRHQEELLALRNEIAELEDKVRDLQVKLTESHSTDVSSDEQKRLQELLDEQTKEMLERQRQNSLEVKELQKKIGTLESQLAESQANSASLDEQQRLQGIVEELKKEMAAKENQNSAEKDDLEQKVEELEEQIHDLVKDLADSRRAPTVSQEQERLQTLVEQQKKEMFARERKSAVELEDLQQKIEELEEYIRDLEEKLAESRESQQKVVHETAQTSAKTEEDDNWGWGEDEDNVEQKVEEDPKKEELGPSLDDEVAQDQLLEVEEKYQDAEESLNEEKEKNAALQEEKEGLSRDASGLREKFEKTSANLNRTEQRAEETERHLREEIETVTKKLQEQEKLEENVVNEQQADAWDDWNDQEDQKPLKPEVKEEPADEDNWGWGEDEPADPVETSSLNKDEVAELNEQLRELAVAQTNLEKDLQAREALILTLEEQLKEANEKYQTLNDTLNELELKFERKEQELEESEKNAQKVKNELLKMREQSDLLKDSEARLLDQADDFATNMEKYSNECQTLRKQLTEVESRRNEVDPVALKEKEDEVQRLRHELEEVEKVLKCLEQKHEAVLQQEEQMKKELKTLKDQNDLLKDSEARLIDQADDYATHMEKYSNECQRLKKQLQERMVDPEAVYEKQVEVEIKSRKLEQMEQFLKDAEQKHAAALRQKEANISQLRQDQGLLEREIEDLKLRIEVVEKERDASKKALSDLKSKIAARSPAGSRPSTPRTRLAPPARHPDPVAEVAEPPAEPAEFRSSAFSPVIPQDFSGFLADTDRYLESLDRIDDLVVEVIGEKVMGRKNKKKNTVPSDGAAVTPSTSQVTSEGSSNNVVSKNVSAVESMPSQEGLKSEKRRLCWVTADPEKEVSLEQELQLRNDTLSIKVEDLMNEVETLKIEVAKAAKSSELMEMEKRELIDSIEVLRKEIGEEKLTSYEIDRQRTENDEVQDLMKMQYDELSKLYEQAVASLKSKEEKCDAIEAARQALVEEIAQLRLGLEAAKGWYAEKYSMMDTLEELRIEKEELLDHMEVFDQRVSSDKKKKQLEIDNLREDLRVLKKNGEDLALKLTESNEKYECIVSKLDAEKKTSQLIMEKNAELESLSEQKTHLEDYKVESERQITDLEQQLLAANQKTEELISEKSEQTAMILGYQDCLRDCNDQKLRIRELEQAIIEQENRNSYLNAELERSQTKINVTSVGSADDVKIEEEVVDHLKQDNVRLERELFSAHESLDNLQAETSELRRAVEIMNIASMEASNEANKLRLALEKAMFEKEQALMANDGRDATNRVLELERELADVRAECSEKMSEMMEELQTCEERLRLAVDCERSANEAKEEMEATALNWCNRFEEAAAANEALGREIDEVHHLEAALRGVREENAAMAVLVDDLKTENGRLVEEGQVLRQQISQMNDVLKTRTERLLQAGEAKMDHTKKIVELESKLANALQAQTAEEKVEESPKTPETLGINVPEKKKSCEIVIEPEEDVGGWGVDDVDSDEFLNSSSSGLIAATSPLPSFLSRFSRRFRLWQHHRNIAVFPYFRYAAAGYFIFVHFLLLHCFLF
ncbi:unnamed protein product [Caenorhabditis auriculariae]|uniref:Uncharacterized protein n=1 Tax=Caenorhabditis auriculariae TaxID=2777116 RepID=A0A8S1HKV3_9PELO|nr:unnamed protein product [Caenorhabditis auriculariae]